MHAFFTHALTSHPHPDAGGNRGHSHTSSMVAPTSLNFSHRIDRLSFAEEHMGAHTLDGDLKVTHRGA